MKSINWNRLKTFYEVAKAKKLTTASEVLNLSQPSLSQIIMNLESEVGDKLFHRTGRDLVLTSSGEKLFDVARVFSPSV